MSEPGSRVPAVTLLRRAEHALFVGLLALGVVQSVADHSRALPAACVAVAMLAWYGSGVVLARRRPADRRAGVAWVLPLCAGWVALVALSADFVWLAFAIFLLVPQLVPLRWAVPAVAGLAVIGAVAVAAHRGRFTTAIAAGPLIGGAVAVMVIVVYRQLRDESERRARLLSELTAAQERLAAAERDAGTAAERERLSHEIHDTLAQSLTSIVMLLRSVDDQAALLPERTRRQLDAAASAARGALADTRRLVRTIAPPALAGQPLAAALRRLAAETAPIGIDVGVEVDGEPYELHAPLAVALLRTAQGALGNVVAHSMAAHARLTLTFQPDRVSLDIADDGRGFDPGAPPAGAGTGIGLTAMRTRLAAVGGTLTVESTPGAGTAISASIPVEDLDA